MVLGGDLDVSVAKKYEYVRKNMKPACPKCITWTSGRTISDSHLRNLELDKVNHVEKIRIEQWKKEHP